MQNNDDLAGRREELQQLSTQQLDQMLQAELQKEDGDPAVVRLILNVLEEREKDMPVRPDHSDEEAWQKYLSRAETGSDKPAKKRNWVLWAACITAVLCATLVTISYDVEAEEFWGRLVRWTDSVIEFFSPEYASGGHKEFEFRTEHPGLQQVYDAVTELGVTQPVVPMWLPEGYALFFCKEYQSERKTTLTAGFQNGDKGITYTVAIYSESVLNQYQKDEGEVNVVEIQGISHYIVRNYDVWVAVWTIENIECSVTIDCQEDELYRILRSIYDKEEA